MQTLTLGHCTVTVPEGERIFPVIVVYGGLRHLEGAWLVGQIPAPIQQSAIFVFPTHFSNNLAQCLSELRQAVPKERLGSYSLCGYSRGGVEVYRYMSLEPWKLLGLIDPTAPTLGGFGISVLDTFKARVRCVYWVPNWGAGGYGGRVPAFAEYLRKKKYKLVEKAIGHEDMPNFFFKTFGQDFLQ